MDASDSSATCQLRLGRAASAGSEAGIGVPLPHLLPIRRPLAPAAAGADVFPICQDLLAQHEALNHQALMAGSAEPANAAPGPGAGAVPARLPHAPPLMHHLLIVPHGPGELTVSTASSDHVLRVFSTF